MKQLRYYLLISVFLWLPAKISACFNEYYTLDKQGNSHHIQKEAFRFYTNFDLRSVEERLKALEKKLQSAPDKELLSDYALNLVRAGKVKEALAIFEKLAAKYPSEYAFQANLGTAYELMGDNKSALKHIKRGLGLYPGSHSGSEWIHVKILEAKIALENNPKYLDNHTVLSLTSKQKKSDQTALHLMIQLKERFPFCKGPDAIMADLFHDLGDCYLETKSYEYAKAFYQVAVEYYKSSDPELNRKIEEARALRVKYENTSIEADPHFSGAQYINEKITGVPYTELLITHSEHTINWEGITTDSQVLLAYLGLNDVAVEMPAKQDSSKDSADAPTQKSAENIVDWVIGGIIVIVVVIVFVVRRKRRRD
ncbi:MAG TPA: tetratricopeptide repeat protein [Fluviicola sp.]|nr:tetratricopeptide repeat protein [Fluviicola sp.]